MERENVLIPQADLDRQREFEEKIRGLFAAREAHPAACVDTFGCQQNVADGQKLMGMLAGLLATCIAVDGYMVGCELLTTAYPGSEGGWHVLSQMFFGATAPYFWIEIIVGVLIPFTILVFAKNRARMGLVAAASMCVVVGVFFKRVWLLLTSFVEFNVMGAPGVASGSSAAAHATGLDMWAVASSYAPTWVEIVVVIGVVSLGALAFVVLTQKLLPARAAKREAVEAAAGEAA